MRTWYPSIFVHKSHLVSGLYFVARTVWTRSQERSCASLYKRLSADTDYRTAWQIVEHEKVRWLASH
jgi:hypothetical protein